MRITTRLLAAAAATLLLPAAAALADPVFGPQTFEAIGDADTLYTETITVDEDGAYAVFVRNGDGPDSRVDGIEVAVDGEIVVDTGDLEQRPAGARRALTLAAGERELTVALSGAPGSFVTIAVVPADELPVFATGRLLLPWGRDDATLRLALALRNGSSSAPRSVRVVFFRPDGSVAAATGRFTLPPRGSLAAPVAELLDGSSWDVGSVAVYWAGPGVARVFGSARQTGPGLWDAEPLQQAGHHVHRGLPAADGEGRVSRRSPR